MVHAFVVVFKSGAALGLALAVVLSAVDDIAAKELLPEGEASRRACGHDKGGQHCIWRSIGSSRLLTAVCAKS